MKERSKKKILVLLLISFSLLSSNFVREYTTSDQFVIIPGAYYILDPALYPNDPLLVEYVKTYPPGVQYLLAGFTFFLKDILLASIVIAVLLKIFFVLSMYLLANYLFKERQRAFFVALLSGFSFYLFSQVVGIIETISSTVVFSFYPLFLYLTLRYTEETSKKIFFVFALLGFLCYINLVAVQPLILILFLLVVTKRMSLKRVMIGGMIFLIILFPYLIRSWYAFAGIDTEVYKLMNERAPELHAPTIANFTMLKFVLLSGLGVLGYWVRKKKTRNDRFIFLWLSIVFVYGLIMYKITDWLQILPNLRPLRVISFFVLLAYIYAPEIMLMLKKRSMVLGAVPLLIMFILSWQFTHLFIPYTHTNAVYCPLLEGAKLWTCSGQRTAAELSPALKELCSVIAKNTEKTDTFLVPPKEGGAIRSCAKRGVVFAAKDSALSKETAYEYKLRRDIITDLYMRNASSTEFEQVAKAYGATYILTERKQKLNLAQVYLNDQYRVYQKV